MVNEALQIDTESESDLWRKAIEKEMTNIKSAFKILEDNEKVPISYQFIKCHMIFDIKMDFTRKARFHRPTPRWVGLTAYWSRPGLHHRFLVSETLTLLHCPSRGGGAPTQSLVFTTKEGS